MAFWGVEVRPGKPYTHRYDPARGRLRVCQATLGNCAITDRCVVQCNLGNKSPILLCSLNPRLAEMCSVELELEEDGEDFVFSVLGPSSVHLSGYYVGSATCHGTGGGSGSETDTYGEDIGETDTDDPECGTDAAEDKYESDFIDDDDLETNAAIIDDIVEDQPASKVNSRKRRRKVVDTDDDDGVEYDNDKEGVDASNMEINYETGKEKNDSADLKSEYGRGLLEQDFSSSFAQEDAERNRASKKKKGNGDAVPYGIENNSMHNNKKEKKRTKKTSAADEKQLKISSQYTPIEGKEDADTLRKTDIVEKKKAKETGAVDEELNTLDQETAMREKEDADALTKTDTDGKSHFVEEKKSANDSTFDGEGDPSQIVAHESAKKTTEKAPNIEKAASDNHVSVEMLEKYGKEQPINIETLSNGLVIEELSKGMPDAKVASMGSKVYINYVGKLQNGGSVFGSNIDQKPVKFRIGTRKVLQGWSIGITGMRVGDRRRLTVPPALGYGEKEVEGIPKSSWLVFDIELVEVK